jgi:alpha-beta hydrolase superfamily lysophospholipase
MSFPLLSVPISIAAASAAAYFMQRNAEKKDWSSLPRKGDFFSHQYAIVRGIEKSPDSEGLPVVVLEASTGGMTQDWSKVIDEVAKFATVVAYDRSGLGFSSGCEIKSLQYPRSAKQLGEELSYLLDSIPSLNTKNGIILVGHGHGAAISVNMARCDHHGAPIKGMLLLDPVCGIQQKHKEVSSETASAIDSMRSGTKTLAQLSKFGLARIFMSLPNSIQSLTSLYRPDDCPTVQALSSRATHRHTVCEEVMCYAEDDKELCNLIETSQTSSSHMIRKDVPILVIGHGDSNMFKELASVGDKNTAQDRLERLEEIWQTGQSSLTRALSPAAVYLRAKSSEHHMPQKNSEMTIEAIKVVFDAAKIRSGRGSKSPLETFKRKHHSDKVLGVRGGSC